MSVFSFANQSYNGLSFTGISLTETDVGAVQSFGLNSGIFESGNEPNVFASLSGIDWSSVQTYVTGPNSSETLAFSYTITDSTSGYGISAAQLGVVLDSNTGSNGSMTGVEKLYSSGVLVGQYSINAANPSTGGTYVGPGDFALNGVYASLTVTLSLTLAEGAGAAATDKIGFSVLETGYSQAAIPPPPGSSGGSTTSSPGAISGKVFQDASDTGVLGSNPGVAGVTVQLYLNNVLQTSTTTLSDGSYSFGSLTPGSGYTVKVVSPNGADVFSPQVATTPGSTAVSLVNSSGVTGSLTVVSGATTTNVDAGLFLPGSLSGTVFQDANADGILTAGETGLSGVSVQLYNGTTLVGTTTTGTGGLYNFGNLVAGTTYSVKVLSSTAPTGDVFSQMVAESTAHPDTSLVSATTGQTGSLSVVAGQNTGNVDAGLYLPGAIKGEVFFDVNDNGILNATETGVSGVTVSLYNGSTLVTTTTTGAGGTYSFTGLAPSRTYSVKVTQPNGDAFSPQVAESTTNPATSLVNATTRQTGAIAVAAGQTVANVDAGLYKSTSGPSIVVTKTPSASVVCSGSNVTFTFKVTNTGNAALDNLKVVDNIGTAANPDYETATAVTTCGGYNVGDTNHDGILGVGETWTYSLTVKETADVTQTYVPGGWSYQSCGCWGGWSYTPGYYTCTQTDASRIDTVTATAETICGTSGQQGCGNNYGQGYDDYGRCCGFNYSSTDGCGDYFDGKGNLVYSDCDGSGYSKSAEYGNWWGNSWGCGGFNNYGSCNTTQASNTSCGSISGCQYNSYSNQNGGNCYSEPTCGGSTNAQSCGYGSYSTYSNCGYGSTGSNGCGSTSTCGTGGGSCTPTVVTATATANVEVLACNSQVTTNGCTPTGDLNCLYGHASKVEFTYHACDTVSSKVVSEGCGSSSGHNGNSCAFVEVTNCNNPHATGGKIYFEGSVTDGCKFYADATTDLTNTRVSGSGCFDASSKTYAFVFNCQEDFLKGVNPVQTICIDTTGGHAVSANDQFGSLQICGYVGATGKGFACA